METEASVSEPNFLHSLWFTSMTVYITTSSMLMEAFCSCSSHSHEHTLTLTQKHTHTQTEKAESLKASLSVFRGDYACITLHAPLATLIQCWTFSFHTFFHLFDSISQLFSPKSPLFPLLHHFNTFFFRLCLLFSCASLTSLTAVQFVHLCYEVASRSFSATLQWYGPRLPGNPTVKSLSVLTGPLKCNQPLLSQIYSVSLYFRAPLNTVQASASTFKPFLPKE